MGFLNFLLDFIFRGWNKDRQLGIKEPIGGPAPRIKKKTATPPRSAVLRLNNSWRKTKPVEEGFTMTPEEWAKAWESMEAELRACIGVKYRFGAEVDLFGVFPPAEIDCSELVELIFSRAGIPVPDGSFNQFARTYRVYHARPGDLGFFGYTHKRVDWNPHGISHVGILLNENTVIEARGRPESKVILTHRNTWEKEEAFKRTGGWRRLKVLRGSS